MNKNDVLAKTGTNRRALTLLVEALDLVESNREANESCGTYDHRGTTFDIKSAIVNLVVIDIPDISEEEMHIITGGA